tara:strand:+ start:112 stop:402 length:291 start_codon:yes stop_codon:yes gene_type:complete
MKIEKVVGDLILLILNNHELLKKLGIDQNEIFVKVEGYDENGMWIHHPGFLILRMKTKKIIASILIPWIFIVYITHFPEAESFDFPSPFEQYIGFN